MDTAIFCENLYSTILEYLKNHFRRVAECFQIKCVGMRYSMQILG